MKETNELPPIIEAQPRGKCELCGAVAECRPYGPRGENICFRCGMKNETQTLRQFLRVRFGKVIQ